MDDGERLYSKKIFCSVHYARLTGQNNQHNELSEYFERKGSELKKKKKKSCVDSGMFCDWE